MEGPQNGKKPVKRTAHISCNWSKWMDHKMERSLSREMEFGNSQRRTRTMDNINIKQWIVPFIDESRGHYRYWCYKSHDDIHNGRKTVGAPGKFRLKFYYIFRSN